MLKQVTPGKNAPNLVNVIIEIPANSDPVKYEVDKETGVVSVDRFMNTAMRYPCEYGYIPQTLGEDGDPVDVLVLAPQPLIPGSMIISRPVGIFLMTDESGPDHKILAVPSHRLSSMYQNIHKPQDIDLQLLKRITHFFEHYKDLEENKWTIIEGWQGPQSAKDEILNAIYRAKHK